MKPDLSLVIACYNEAPHLEQSVEEIEAIMNQTKYAYEFIFIDDCSKDKTREVIKKICAQKNNRRAIFHEKNVGRGGTVREGLLLSKAAYAGFLDIDLEVHARYIPGLLLLLERGYDMVSIDRVEKLALGFNEILRLILSKGYNKLAHLYLGLTFPDSEAGFKFFNLATMRSVIESTQNKGWFWDTEIVYRAEKAQKKMKSIQGVFERNSEKQSTVRIIPDSIAFIKAGYRFKQNEKKHHL